MSQEISKTKLILVCLTLVLSTVYTWAGIGYFTPYFDVWTGAIVGAVLGGITAVLLWKYVR